MSDGKRYGECGTGGRKWTPEEDHLLLEALIPCQREAQIRGACDRLAANMGRGNRTLPGGGVNGALVRRRAWGLITRNEGTLYQPSSMYMRTTRTSPEPTLFETELLTAALESRAAGAVHNSDDVFYFAKVLNRPHDWVERVLREIDPRRKFEGFGF